MNQTKFSFKRVGVVCALIVLVFLAWAPWIRDDYLRAKLLEKKCPIGPNDDGSCLYQPNYQPPGTKHSVIQLPFVVMIKAPIMGAWGANAKDSRATIFVTAFNTVHAFEHVAE